MLHRSAVRPLFLVGLSVLSVAACGPELVDPARPAVEAERTDIEGAVWGDHPLEVLFTPDDEPIPVEVALERCRARLAAKHSETGA